VRKQVAIYEECSVPRPDVWTRIPEPTRAKKFPRYVHGKVGMAMLLHKIEYVNLKWYGYGRHEFVRLKSPSLIAHTVCGAIFHLAPGRAGVCELPAPDAVLCGRCHGTGTIWGHGKTPTVTKRYAKDHLGCVVQGESR
jgi:hypothetical protein